MKKLMILMLVLVAVPAMAAVQLTATPGTEANEVEIGYVSDSNVVSGFALKVVATDGTIDNVIPAKTGESVSGDLGYGIFPGSIDINDAGEVQDWGSVVAPSTAPGADGTGLGTDTVILEMGALYVDGNEPPLSGTLCTVVVSDGTSQICVDANTPLRGGVVYADATQADTDLTDACATLAEPECFDSSHADYDEWVAVGKPESWCYEYQCYGDADGQDNGAFGTSYRVGAPDLGLLIDGWKKEYNGDPAAQPWIAADFNREDDGAFGTSYRVGAPDLGILINNWKDDSNIPSNPDCGGDM